MILYRQTDYCFCLFFVIFSIERIQTMSLFSIRKIERIYFATGDFLLFINGF